MPVVESCEQNFEVNQYPKPQRDAWCALKVGEPTLLPAECVLRAVAISNAACCSSPMHVANDKLTKQTRRTNIKLLSFWCHGLSYKSTDFLHACRRREHARNSKTPLTSDLGYNSAVLIMFEGPTSCFHHSKPR